MGREHGPVGDGGGKKVQHAYRIPPVKGGGLGDVADDGTAPLPVGAVELEVAGVGQLAQDGLEEGGFPRPVGADQGHDLSAVEVEGDGAQQLLAAHGDPYVLQLQAAQPLAAVAGAAVMVVNTHEKASRRVFRLESIASR